MECYQIHQERSKGNGRNTKWWVPSARYLLEPMRRKRIANTANLVNEWNLKVQQKKANPWQPPKQEALKSLSSVISK